MTPRYRVFSHDDGTYTVQDTRRGVQTARVYTTKEQAEQVAETRNKEQGAGMNLPATETLKQLLDQAKPGPWTCETAGTIYTGPPDDEDLAEHVISMNRYWEIKNVNRPEDFKLAALAPELATEVLRLREELERMRHLHQVAALKSAARAQNTAQPAQGVHARFENHHTRVVENINRILGTEGQP